MKLIYIIVPQYLLKYNDVKTKRGVELAEHLLAYHQAQETYFKDNSNLINALKQWESKFQGQITEVGGADSLSQWVA